MRTIFFIKTPVKTQIIDKRSFFVKKQSFLKMFFVYNPQHEHAAIQVKRVRNDFGIGCVLWILRRLVAAFGKEFWRFLSRLGAQCDHFSSFAPLSAVSQTIKTCESFSSEMVCCNNDFHSLYASAALFRVYPSSSWYGDFYFLWAILAHFLCNRMGFFIRKNERHKSGLFFLAVFGLFVTFGLSLSLFSVSAMLLAAVNGIASGGEIATSKKSTMHYSSLQITAYSWIFILLTHFPISLMNGEQQLTPAFNLEWLAMLGYAASGLGGFWLVIEGFKHVDASIGGLIGLLEIIFSFLFGVFLFDDHITLAVLLGGIIILLSAVLPDIYALKHPKEKPLPPPPPL